MMAKMGRLPPNGVPTVAVCAPDLALVDLRLEKRQRMLIEGQRHHALAALGAHVVELQDNDVCFPATDTRSLPKILQEETQVASLERPVSRHARFKVHAP
jgi:hypothetical protein